MTQRHVHVTLAIFIGVCLAVIAAGTVWLTDAIWLAMLRAAMGV